MKSLHHFVIALGLAAILVGSLVTAPPRPDTTTPPNWKDLFERVPTRADSIQRLMEMGADTVIDKNGRPVGIFPQSPPP